MYMMHYIHIHTHITIHVLSSYILAMLGSMRRFIIDMDVTSLDTRQPLQFVLQIFRYIMSLFQGRIFGHYDINFNNDPLTGVICSACIEL